mmetsp:Transcript_8952/g.22182  ORF Transcript_8952/g.22182 Transcript_8952/m.22182 type:complete len:453 (-) Transcript_8952:472-1830(-)
MRPVRVRDGASLRGVHLRGVLLAARPLPRGDPVTRHRQPSERPPLEQGPDRVLVHLPAREHRGAHPQRRQAHIERAVPRHLLPGGDAAARDMAELAGAECRGTARLQDGVPPCQRRRRRRLQPRAHLPPREPHLPPRHRLRLRPLLRRQEALLPRRPLPPPPLLPRHPLPPRQARRPLLRPRPPRLSLRRSPRLAALLRPRDGRVHRADAEELRHQQPRRPAALAVAPRPLAPFPPPLPRLWRRQARGQAAAARARRREGGERQGGGQAARPRGGRAALEPRAALLDAALQVPRARAGGVPPRLRRRLPALLLQGDRERPFGAACAQPAEPQRVARAARHVRRQHDEAVRGQSSGWDEGVWRGLHRPDHTGPHRRRAHTHWHRLPLHRPHRTGAHMGPRALPARGAGSQHAPGARLPRGGWAAAAAAAVGQWPPVAQRSAGRLADERRAGRA